MPEPGRRARGSACDYPCAAHFATRSTPVEKNGSAKIACEAGLADQFARGRINRLQSVMTSPQNSESPRRTAFMLRALAHRNYRLFFGGQIVSLVGTWLASVATSWLVYRLASESMPARSAFLLGAVGFAAQFPVFLIGPLAGVFADHFNRHRILIATQVAFMVHSFVLAVLTYTGRITIGQILFLSLVHGLIRAFDLPTRQALVVQLVPDRADLGNAIALNSSMVHTARLIGPAIAGFMIYRWSEAVCFFVDSVSFFFVIFALLRMRLPQATFERPQAGALQSLRDGLSYAVGFAPIRTILLLVAATSLMAMSQTVLMPVFADRVYGGRERTLGLLLGASGFGAVCGSLYLASRRTVLGLGRVLVAATCVLGAGLIAFAWSRNLALGMGLLTITGFSMVVQLASSNTLIQTIVDDDKRGRVMSLFTTAFMGMTPFGSLLGGTLASGIGAPATLTLAGIGCLLGGSVFALRLPALRALVRPIYVERGILPPIAAGLSASAAEAVTTRT